jgi:hypothetical protein
MEKTSQNGLASVPAVTHYLRSACACGIEPIPFIDIVGIDPNLLKVQ